MLEFGILAIAHAIVIADQRIAPVAGRSMIGVILHGSLYHQAHIGRRALIASQILPLLIIGHDAAGDFLVDDAAGLDNAVKQVDIYPGSSGGDKKLYTKITFGCTIEMFRPIAQRKVKCMANQTNSLTHTRWGCKYYIVLCPEY